tara:strand:- start:21194 stop:22564 length:1371 start_codon:yes stop_codon:yes gene_type:complete
MFQLGVCEYRFGNYGKATNYFNSAEAKGFQQPELLQKYSTLSKKALLAGDRNFNDFTKASNSPSPMFSSNERYSRGYLELLRTEREYEAQNRLFNVLFLIIAAVGATLGCFLIFKYGLHKNPNFFLAMFLIAISLTLLELAMFWWRDNVYVPRIPFYRIHFFAWGPCFYLYFKYRFLKEDPFKKREIQLHFALFATALLALMVLGSYERSPIQDHSLANYCQIFLENKWLKAAQISFYFVLMVRIYKKTATTLTAVDRIWIRILVFYFLMVILTVCGRALYSGEHTFDYISKYFVAILLSLFITMLGFLLLVRSSLVTKKEVSNELTEPKKYKNSGLTEDMSLTLKSGLLDLLEKQKVYLDNTLTLESLALKMNTDRYSLSQVINQEFGKNFYEIINDYRVGEALLLIKKTRSTKSVNDLIYESGFNNKVSFYKAFKKRKNMTPTEYMTSVQNTES